MIWSVFLLTICGSIILKGNPPEAQVQQALNRMFQIKEALRISVEEENCHVSQQVLTFSEEKRTVYHFNIKEELYIYAEALAEKLWMFSTHCQSFLLFTLVIFTARW